MKSLGKGLERLLSFNGDIESEYDRSFQVDIQSFGHVLTCDLKPDGAKIQLTRENSAEFVDLYTRFVLTKSIEKQFNAFREGFQLVCQDSAIKVKSIKILIICLYTQLYFYRFLGQKK